MRLRDIPNSSLVFGGAATRRRFSNSTFDKYCI